MTSAPAQADLVRGLLARERLAALSLPKLNLLSPEFRHGETLPTRCTVDGDGSPPSLWWGLLEPKPASFLVVCQDPDAPGNVPFVHWLVYRIAGSATSLDSNLNDFDEGANDHGETGYAPAAPPPGHGSHRYCFQLFALDTEVRLPSGADYERVIGAVSGHVMVWGEIIGRYQRV